MKKEEKKLDVEKEYKETIERFVNKRNQNNQNNQQRKNQKENLHVDSMQQIRHKNFEQNPCLINILAKSVACWACLPSKALLTKETREIDNVNKLHCIVNKKELQHVGRISSGQQRKVHG